MARPLLEVADVLNQHGDAYRRAHAGHLSLGQLKVMGAIRACRTAALGGHVARCEGCASLVVGTRPDNVEALRFYEARGFRRLTGGGVHFRIGVENNRPGASS